VRLNPLGTSATIWPIVPAQDGRWWWWWWWWVWSSRWNENWQGKPKYSEKILPSAILSTVNPTWSDLGSNPGRRCRKQATNHLTYDTAWKISYITNCKIYHFVGEFHVVCLKLLWLLKIRFAVCCKECIYGCTNLPVFMLISRTTSLI
jgi:hypothetical protein